MTVALIDYGSGNLHSARKAFELAAADLGLAEEIVLTSEPDVARRADRIVLPGVGAFADCKRGLDAITGMDAALREAVLERGRPFLGICVGMQLLATRGHEHTETEGLGWIPGHVRELKPSDPRLKIPHMGWNNLRARRPHPLLEGIATGEDGLHAYFVHSFHFIPDDSADIIAATEYGGEIAALVGRGNIAGTQFHPEKSQKLGLALIANFLRWRP